MKIKTKINFGDKVRDKITNFEGVVAGFCSYITGCNQFLIIPKCKDNERTDGDWFDEGRLKIIKKELSKKDVEGKTNGCDMAAPIK